MFKSTFSPIEVPEFPLHAALMFRIESFGNDVAVVNAATGEELTFSQVLTGSRNAASALTKMGLKKGGVVAIMCPNIPQYPIVLLATWACGGMVTTVNPVYTEHEVAFHLKDAKPSFLVTTRESLPKVRNACKEYSGLTKIITIKPCAGCMPFSELTTDDGSRYPDDVEINAKDDVAMLLYSSGTTGMPKGVMLTHYNILFNVAQMGHEDCRIVSEEEGRELVIMGVLPFFHAAGFVGQILPCLGGGAKLICIPKFEPHSYLKTVEKYKASFLPLVPPLVVFMNKSPLLEQYDLSSVRISGAGAAPLKADQINTFKKKLGLGRFTNSYGMTEATCIATVWRKTLPPSKTGSVGQIVANMEAKIQDPDTGKLCGPKEPGEICFRGPTIMKGYLNRPQATRDTIDSDGFLHTGDIGYVDEDGFLFIVDRLKELIKYKGFQVAPAELEGTLLGHSDVTDVGVIGVPDPDAGELPKAYVVRKAGSTVTAGDLEGYVQGRVAPFKRLRGGVVFIDAIPRNQSGKVLRRRLAEMHRAKSKI